MIARMISAVTVTFGTAERYRSMRVADLGLETFDLVPQGAVLALVGRPYLLLRHLPELLDLGFHHGHAERLQLRLRLGEIIDRLGRLADFLLRGARQIHDQLLLIGRKAIPDLEVHHRVGRAVIVIGERSVFRHFVDLQRLHVDDGQIAAVDDALLGGADDFAIRHRHRAAAESVDGVAEYFRLLYPDFHAAKVFRL